MKKILIIVIFFAIPALCWSDGPVITSIVNSTLAHGETVTIGVSGFGTKSPVAPVFFDNFETGTGRLLNNSGTNPDGSRGTPTWDERLGLEAGTYSSGQAYGVGSQSGYDRKSVGDEYRSANEIDDMQASDEAYYSIRVRFSAPASLSSDVWKMHRVTYNDYQGDPQFNCMTTGNAFKCMNDRNYFGSDYTQWYVDIPTRDTWFRDEMYFKLSAPGGTANGTCQYARNLSDLINITDMVTRASGDTDQITTFISPLMIENITGTWDVWIDDVYFDNTRARVEIGNAATWSACTNREIQIPKDTWGDTAINFIVNRGAFGVNDNAYLYVVDSDGNVSDGYPITFGTTYGETATVTGGITFSGCAFH